MKYGLGMATLLLALACSFHVLYPVADSVPAAVVVPSVEARVVEADAAQVHQFCGMCHAYPPPETFPRGDWPQEVRKGYDFFREAGYRLPAPDMEAVIAYYRQRAPVELPRPTKLAAARAPLPVTLESSGWSPAAACPAVPRVTHVQLAHLFHKDRLDLIVCHTDPGRIWAVRPYDEPPSWHLLAEILAPCHVEVADLDGDGRPDLIVADLGSFFARNEHTGRVIWLRNLGEGRFVPITLLDDVGRVADVQVADLNGDGKLDLVVAVFGWRSGAILYLENRTTDWKRPAFHRTVLDRRAGAIHVPIGDIDGDGHPDIVGLISQEHECVVASLGDGKGGFRRETIYQAPHPAYGSSGIQLVDLDGDGDLDVLYTNGDVLDPPYLLKPYHGVQWLENRGAFPFIHHPLVVQYGATRALAVDLDGDGALDIVSVAFLPSEHFPTAAAEGAESLQVLRQYAPGRFERHVLETAACHHFTCAAGDLFGDGRVHLVVGNYFITPAHARGDLLSVWKNCGSKMKPGPDGAKP
jgi:hypothetical protein